MSCEPCEGLNYVYTIYSLMGGNVVRGEGIFETDSISVSSINTTGVLDGVIKLTIQVTDTEDKLVATKTAEYTKDTVLPNSYYSQSNLENDGTSSLDDFVIAVVIESVDVGGTYDLNIENTASGKSTKIMSLNFQGALNTETTSLDNIDLSTLADGVYKFELMVTDPNGNRGEPEVLYYKKEVNLITLIGSDALDVLNYNLENIKSYPNPFSEFYIIESIVLIKLEVYDINGKIILKKQLVPGKNKINGTNLSKGFYLFKFKDLNRSNSKILIKE